jgi:hypothetical protein
MGMAPPITGINSIAGFPIFTLGVEGEGNPNTDGTFNGGSSKLLVIFVRVEDDELCGGITTTFVDDDADGLTGF